MSDDKDKESSKIRAIPIKNPIDLIDLCTKVAEIDTNQQWIIGTIKSMDRKLWGIITGVIAAVIIQILIKFM